MGQERIDAIATAVHKIDHALGQPGLLQQLDQEHDRERNFLARFQDEGVSARDRQGKHPHRDHGGKVKRRDSDADAEWLIQRFTIDPTREVLQGVAEKQRRNAARIFNILDAAIRAPPRFGQRLAMLPGYALADPIEVFLDELTVAKENTGAFHRRGFAPRRKGRRRGLDRFVDEIGATHGHFGNSLAARRIEDGRSGDAGNIAPLAADVDGTGNHGKAPSSKHQAPKKLQAPSSKSRRNIIGDTCWRR
jgi:hypothetical protein